MPMLAKEYTVAAFDRRGNMRSALAKEDQKHLNMPQQARDVIAIIRDLGFEKAHIHGNSGGGVIALQLASMYPEYVDAVVAHESPTAAILPDVGKILDFDEYVYDTFRQKGTQAAWKAFSECLVGFTFDGELIPHETGEFFFECEYLIFGLHTPDLNRIRDNKVRLAVARGEESGDAWYARATARQSEIIGCRAANFPGHHLAFAVIPEVYTQALSKLLQHLQAQ